MEFKKSSSADIYNKRKMFFFLGLTVSLSIVILAFEWKFYEDNQMVGLGMVKDNFDEMIEIPPTHQPPPPPPKIQQPEIIEVPDEEEIEEEIDVDVDIEITEDEVLEEIIESEPIEEEVTDEIFIFVEKNPEFPGGQDAFNDYLVKNVKYPIQALKMGIEGRVFVEFVVEPDGSISNTKVLRGIGAGCDEEALRVVKGFPKWSPGRQRGRPVRTRIVVPLNFKIG